MPTQSIVPGGLESESTAELPRLPGNAAQVGPDRLQATDSWRIEPALGDERIGPNELGAVEFDRRGIELQVGTLQRQLAARDGWIAALEGELQQREARLRGLEAQISRLEEELQQSRSLPAPAPAVSAPAAPAAPVRPERPPLQRLLVRTKGARGIVHVLDRRTTVGRMPDNDLRVEAEFISRHHAVLVLDGSDTVLEDLHSTNGTFVNGEQIERRTLREGDLVTFGKILYRFVIKPAG